MIPQKTISALVEDMIHVWGRQVLDSEPDGSGIDRRLKFAEVLATATSETHAQSAVDALIKEKGRMYCPTPGELVMALESAPERSPETEQEPDSACELCFGTGQRLRYYREQVHQHDCGPVSYWHPVSDEEHQAIREGRMSTAGLQSGVTKCPCWQPVEVAG
jgi:hypothetical protein